MIDVREFLLGYFDRPMTWGVDDCSLILADWWRENHGTDPAATLRGTYSSESEKAAIVVAAGGLVPLVAGLAGLVSAQISAANRDGDFGVIVVRGGGLVSGIRVGRFWGVRSEIGITYTSDARLVRGWSI
jgi:hypothetical protein